MQTVYNVSATPKDSDRSDTVEIQTARADEQASPLVWNERPTETQRVYLALKRAILANVYRPGEALQEVRIASEYGSSRTPVREAFHKLEADGLLTIVPRRGAFVQQPTVSDFLDINELRLILEPVAARQAAIKLADSTVHELQLRLQQVAPDTPSESDVKALEALDSDMHVTIADSVSNARLGGIINGLNDMMQIVRKQDIRLRHAELHASIGEILDALAARDDDLAESLMRHHVSDFSGSLRSLV